jgi:hypothetical protein
MTLIIVMWLSATKQFYVAEPKVQFSCHYEAMQLQQEMKAKFPEHDFLATCLPRDEVFKVKK